jgi:hypothetical protein
MARDTSDPIRNSWSTEPKVQPDGEMIQRIAKLAYPKADALMTKQQFTV